MRGRFVTPTRQGRLQEIRRLSRQGYSSRAIGQRTGLAPTTVRDYLNDPYRRKARARQGALAVRGVSMPAGGTPIESVASRWKRGGPHRGRGAHDAYARGVQLRSVIGYYAGRRGR